MGESHGQAENAAYVGGHAVTRGQHPAQRDPIDRRELDDSPRGIANFLVLGSLG